MYRQAHSFFQKLLRTHMKPKISMDIYIPFRSSSMIYGPDQVIPSHNQYTVKPDGNIKLRISEGGVAAKPSISVPGLMKRAVTRFPNNIALSYNDPNGKVLNITFVEYAEMVATCAKAFIKLGLEKFHSVCILGLNSPEWIISDLGAIFAGGFSVGVYTTNSPEACLQCANISRANIIVVQDPEQLQKFLAVKDKLTTVKAIVQYEGLPTEPGVLSWEELMQIGREQSDEDLDQVLSKIATNECCKLVFTSGTTGKPKAVMLCHDNLTWTGRVGSNFIGVFPGDHVFVSYLPLSHVAAQAFDIYMAISVGATVFFADKNALKGTLIESMRGVKPTVFLGIPRVWEKISEGIVQVTVKASRVSRSIIKLAREIGLKHHLDKMNGVKGSSVKFKLVDAIMFKHIRRTVGLDNCTIMLSGAAPLSLDVKRKCWSFGFRVVEAFGMSETSGCHTANSDSAFHIESIGKTVPGCSTKILNPDANNHGEILMKGRNIFMGYLNDIPNTEESFDEDGWLHSGDLGYIDSNEFVHITGRTKEVIITAGGENIAPILIEENIACALKCVSNVLVIGDKRKFLVALLTLKTLVNDETGEPLDELSTAAKNWCQRKGSDANTVSEIIKTRDEKVYAGIQAGIDRANERALSRPQRVQKFAILPHLFTVQTGELGPTLKIKRNVIYKKYADVIESLYKN